MNHTYSIQATFFFLLFSVSSISCALDTPKSIKPWTVIIYIAADNDLRGFAARNIKQMAAIGSNPFLNICVELHIRISGNKKITRRYYIEENKILHVNAEDPYSQKMDSGDPKTLVSCFKWFASHYPAEHYALILWNHGTGILDPIGGRIINSTELFTFNPAINKLELDRSVDFLDLVENYSLPPRGICWDDSTGNYLNNQKLDSALNEITTHSLNGKKIDVLGFDACLMSMLEVATIVKKYAHIMVSSQEVELGTGWNYQQILQPFLTNMLTKEEFASHIVTSYGKAYNKITNDYTLSAINLDTINILEENVNTIAKLLLECLKRQHNNSVKNAIKNSRDEHNCTRFDERSYIDLHHFYKNLQANLAHCSLHQDHANTLQALNDALYQGCSHIKSIVLANIVGKNLPQASGISIYFPEDKKPIHSTYKKTAFADSNEWFSLLSQYKHL